MKKVLKLLIRIIGILLLVGMIIVGGFLYILKYQVTYVDESTYEHYSLVLEELGEPFLFGSATGRITLKDDGHTIKKEKMDVANDGMRIGKGNWNVEWHEDHVLVYIFQDEGYTIEYTIYYDPSKELQKELQKPDDIIGPIPSTIDEKEIDEAEEKNLLALEESKEMLQIATFLGYNDYEIKMSAKGVIVLIIDELRMARNQDHEYVLTKGDEIIGFYRMENGQVIDEKRTSW